MFLEWLRNGLSRPGKSQRGLAAHLGVSESVVSRMLSGEREIKARELEKMASYLGQPIPEKGTRVEHLPAVPVTKIAAPFVWREQGEVVMSERARVPFVPDERFRGRQQFAVLIEGTKRYAVCVGITASEAVQPGDLLVVERTNSVGMIETTVRRVEACSDGLNVAMEPRTQGVRDVIHSIDDVTPVGRVLGFYEAA